MGEYMTGLKRSHMCAEVNEKMIGENVTVMGWVQRRRDLGQLLRSEERRVGKEC